MEEEKKIKLYVKDTNNELTLLYDTITIFEMDCFTYQFNDKKSFLDEISKKYNKKFVDVFLEISSRKRRRYTNNVIYRCNEIPDIEKLDVLYSDYLLEDRRRIKDSFIRYLPKLKGADPSLIEEDILRFLVKKRKKSYSEIRDIYFELLKSGKVKPVKVPKEPNGYLKSLIDSIDTDYTVFEGERNDEEIMIDKIRSGEIEPSYYDLEEYISIKNKGHRR